MQKTLDIQLTASETGRISSAIAKCDLQLREIFRQMKRDQVEINRLKTQTGKILAEIKAEMEKINTGLLDGTIKTNVSPVKP